MNELIVLGEKRVQQLFAMAPKAFTNAMAHWMWRERRSFVGNKEKGTGSWRKSLRNKKRKDTGEKWGVGMGLAFTGNINHPKQLSNMTLDMGVTDKWRGRIPYIDILSTGGTITPKNKKWLIIPNYKNLRSIGMFGRIGGSGSKNTWSGLMAKMDAQSGFQQPFVYHGKLLFFGDFPDKGGSHEKRHMHHLHRKLLFVGVKQTQIRKQFDFVKRFESRCPGMVKRADNMVKQTLRGIERGKIAVA